MIENLQSASNYSAFIQDVSDDVPLSSTACPISDDDVEDVTPVLTNMINNVREHLENSASSHTLQPAVAQMRGNAVDATNWTHHHLPIFDDAHLRLHPQKSASSTSPYNAKPETRWTFYEKKLDENVMGEDTFEDTKDLECSTYASSNKMKPRVLSCIEEGIEPTVENRHFECYSNDTSLHMGEDRQISSQQHLSNKRWRGRMQTDDRRHSKIMKSLQDNNGIYRVQIRQDEKIQSDHGANICLTDNKSLLLHYKSISKKSVDGCSKDGPALKCEGVGFFPWYARTGERLLVRTYYSPSADGTIFSPTAVQQQYQDRYNGWSFSADCDNSSGVLTLHSRDGVSHVHFDSYMENRLWFHYIQLPSKQELSDLNQDASLICRKLNNQATYELWHNRLGHPGQHIMDTIHNHVEGVPKLDGNRFYHCPICLHSKFRKKARGKRKNRSRKIPKKPPFVKTDSASSIPPDKTPLHSDKNLQPGESLYMDFGFVRGTDWTSKDEEGRTVTSIDGKRAYLLIIDEATRWIWVFPTVSKSPPLDLIKGVLDQFPDHPPGSTIRCDQGGELGRSQALANLISREKYILQRTGAFSSSQNGMAEKPNQDLAQSIRCLLQGAGLGSEYWSYALRHAVYLKNRLPHSALKKTSFEAMNGSKPNLSHLRVFGSKVTVQTSERNAKLDQNNKPALFMTFTATDKNVCVVDVETGREKISRHAVFDEAHMTSAFDDIPPYASALHRAGYRKELDLPSGVKPRDDMTIKYRFLSEAATEPTRSTNASAGLDLYSATTFILPPGEIVAIPTDLAIELDHGTYGQIQPRSGLALHDGIFAIPGVIDSDYRGNVKVLLLNTTNEQYHLQKGARMCQLITHKIPLPTMEHSSQPLSSTERGTQGFGSTELLQDSLQQPSMTNFHETNNQDTPHVIPLDDTYTSAGINEEGPFVVKATVGDLLYPFSIALSHDPYDNVMVRQLSTSGDHPTRGLVLEMCAKRNLPRINECLPGTPAAKLPKWRSTLRGAYVLKIDDTEISTFSDVENIFRTCDSNKEVHLTVGTIDKVAMHPDDGIPMLYFDQLSMIADHLRSLRYGTETSNNFQLQQYHKPGIDRRIHAIVNTLYAFLHDDDPLTTAKAALLNSKAKKPPRLTRKMLRNQDDWAEWQQSEWKQLDQYEAQETFGQPCKLPPGSNCLSLMWIYLIKSDAQKTKKSRCVCNGSPRNKGSVTWGHTYAKALDQVGHRIFWAAAASKNFIVRGCDASNAFAEAPPPKHPLFVRIDKPFRDWWASKKRPPIPDNFVLPVRKALQGHPESPRLWAQLIDNILTTHLGLKPTTHEPCLYHGTFDGEEVLFLRQVDDFSCGSSNDTTVINLIKALNSKLSIDVKDLGVVDRYNGLDIEQTKHFIKIKCTTYIEKILNGNSSWLDMLDPHSSPFPIPMRNESKFQETLENAQTPQTEKDGKILEQEMGFSYRRAIGELIYAMVSCRPDISFPVIKLSQYSANPAKEHYIAVKEVYKYLRDTKEDGLYFWRSTPNPYLSEADEPVPKPDVYSPQHAPTDCSSELEGLVDATWANDSSHRRSVTGIALMFAGGCVYYKTKFQPTIALSSTESEFAAACDAGKAILYVRSILDEINMPQHEATVLYIDNRGALLMANAQQPTRRTRHVSMKHFALLD